MGLGRVFIMPLGPPATQTPGHIARAQSFSKIPKSAAFTAPPTKEPPNTWQKPHVSGQTRVRAGEKHTLAAVPGGNLAVGEARK